MTADAPRETTARAELLARRAVLLPIYSEPGSDEQAVEVATELFWIDEQLRLLPREAPTTVAPKKAPRRAGRDARALAAGNDA